MKLIVLTVSKSKPSKHGGTYKRVIFVGVEDNKHYRLDVYDAHSLSRKWMPYIKPQSVFQNVNILPNTNIVDGTSQFSYVGQRHIEKSKEDEKV